MPLLEERGGHWLLVCADCHLQRFVVYDSFAHPRDLYQESLIHHAIMSIALSMLRTSCFGSALTWDVVRPNCPQQGNGYDHGVFVMAFMDLISIRPNAWRFSHHNVRQFRDKCLVSLPRGRIANFPHTLTGFSPLQCLLQ
uniref:Ubiquitin-like protease family profile domain-containing protein n=1 Tax=Opuntia streptacantha TaxID=393608 RepID=A0A7C9DCL2_OPUST